MLLSVKNLSKHFTVRQGMMAAGKRTVRAVDGVSLDIEKGDSLCLVGESGCGKTTLARLMMRLIEPQAGEIIYNGENITKWRGAKLMNFRRNVQMVFQDPYSSLDPRFTVRRIIKEGMTLAVGRHNAEQAQELRAQEMISAVGLRQDMLSRYPHEFSGGERQRIAIARALALSPTMLILDEAVSSLDVIIQQELLDLLSDLQQRYELTYVFIAHNLRLVKKISNKIAVMYKGRLVEFASKDEIFNNPLHPYTQELLQAALDYRSPSRKEEITIGPNAALVEWGKGHWVMHE